MAYAGKLTYKTELDTSGVQKAGSTVKSIIAGLGITKMISMAMSEINNSIDGAIARVDTLNNFPKVMSNLGISAQDADKQIKRMADKLSGLPTTLDQGALAVQRFTSANGDVKKSTDIFLALNNALLAGGASTEIQATALEQMSQAYAKGKPDMMEWRALQTAMPAQLKQVATAMGYESTALLGEAVRSKDGAEIFAQMMDTIVELNEKGAEGFESFEKQARNSTAGIGTAITVAKTQVVKGVTDIIDALNVKLEDLGIGKISDIIANFGKKAKNGLDQIAKLISGELSFKDFFNSGMNAIINFLNGINQSLPKIIEKAGEIINDLLNSLIENLPQIIELGMQIISNLIIGIAQQLPTLIPKIVEVILTIVESLIDNIDLIIDAGIELIIGLTEGLINALPILIEKIPIIIDKLITKLTDPEMIGKILQASARLVTELAIGLIKAIPSLLRGVSQIKDSIIRNLYNLVSNMGNIGKDLVRGIWTGIINSLGWLKSKIIGWIGNVTGFIKKMFKIGSPSKLWADEIGKWLPRGVAVGIDANTDSIEDSINDMYKEMNRTIKMENSKMNFDVVSGDIYNKSFFQAPVAIELNADVEMDSQKVGRLVTPSVTRTIKNGGGI